MPLMIALGLWMILFLALFFIRRTLTPLAVLQAGTKRVGSGDFDGRVEIASGDEFEQLAGSFNAMSGQLRQPFFFRAGDYDGRRVRNNRCEGSVEVKGKKGRSVNESLHGIKTRFSEKICR